MRLYGRILSVFSSGVILVSSSGCKKVPSASFSSSSVSTSVSNFSSSGTTFSSSTGSSIISDSKSFSTTLCSSVTQYVSSCSSSDNSFLVVDYFSSLGNDVKSSYESFDFLDIGKLYFITCVDFLFYDGSINGIRFSDMSDKARSQLICDICFIDDLICSKYPDYKEYISYGASDLYLRASDIIKSHSINVSDYSREKLGDETYYSLGMYKDLFIEQTSRDWDSFSEIVGDAYSFGKSKVKSKYDGFRGR